MRILSLVPTRKVSDIQVDKTGLMTYQNNATRPNPFIAQPGALPSEYVAPEGFSPPPCSSSLHSWIGAQVRRTGPESAAVLGLDIPYLDERGALHVYQLALNFVLCGQRNPELEDQPGLECAPEARTAG